MVQITFSKGSGISAIKMNAFIQLRDHFIDIHQLTKALSKWPLYVQSSRISVQLPTHLTNILNLFIVVCLHSLKADLKSTPQLIQHRLLRRFIGMQLQAKILNPQGSQSLLNHLQSRHLLRHKKHSLSLREGVGHHCRDGL